MKDAGAVSFSSDIPITPPRLKQTFTVDMFSPLRFLGDIKDLALTSPLHLTQHGPSLTPSRREGSQEWSPLRVDLCVKTPPPPSPFTSLQTTRGTGSVERARHTVTPKRSTIKHLLRLCGCSPTLQQNVERLGWVGEQMLCSSLEVIIRTLSQVEQRCQEVEWQQLQHLRDVFLRSAITHIETCLSVYGHACSALPPSITILLDQFCDYAREITVSGRISSRIYRQRSNGKEESTQSSTPSRNLSFSLPSTAFPRFPSFVGISTENIADKSILPLPDTEYMEKPDSVIGSPLSRRFSFMVRKQSVARLRHVLSLPVPTQYTREDAKTDASEKSVAYYSSPVIRRAQRRLGELWALMDDVGVGTSFGIALRQGNRSAYRSKPSPITSSLSQFRATCSGPFLLCKANGSGALALMGARCARRGRYISRRSVQMKTKRTREKKQKRQAALQNVEKSIKTVDV